MVDEDVQITPLFMIPMYNFGKDLYESLYRHTEHLRRPKHVPMTSL